METDSDRSQSRITSLSHAVAMSKFCTGLHAILDMLSFGGCWIWHKRHIDEERATYSVQPELANDLKLVRVRVFGSTGRAEHVAATRFSKCPCCAFLLGLAAGSDASNTRKSIRFVPVLSGRVCLIAPLMACDSDAALCGEEVAARHWAPEPPVTFSLVVNQKLPA
jgi:hypothetical protein